MTPERLQQIKSTVAKKAAHADRILDGDDNYDGADGARYVADLCALCDELIAEVERKA